MFVIHNPVPTIEETRIRLGMSKRRVEQIKKIMASPVPRRKRDVLMRTTYTYAVLPVSHAAYAEIKSKLTDAGYTDQFHDNRDGDGVVIDMHGIALSDEGEKTMEPHQQRVVAEKTELSDKLDKLETFVDGSIYSGLPPAEQSRLTRQLLIMKLYEQVLSERVSAF